MPNNSGTGTKGVLMVIGAYIVTIVIIIFSIMLVMFFLVDTHSCSAMSRALATLWTIIGIVFIVSTLVVGAMASKLIANRLGCLATMFVYTSATLVCSGLLSFGMMVAFNC